MNCQVSFGAIPHTLYDEVHKCRPQANGTEPDKGILRVLQKYFPKGGVVADVGAGYGRNAIPIAKMGYQVDAFEVSKTYRKILAESGKDLPELKILRNDILDTSLEKEKYDVVLMSHVSQHFNTNEMGAVVSNFFEGLKKGGLAIFDALVDKAGKMPECSKDDIKEGVGYFKDDFVEDLAKKNNFDLKSRHYDRNFDTGSDYIGPYWGFGDKDHPSYRPVTLKWFFLKKPS